ncbi:glycyl-tRNA synthetase [Gonapodya prolifera JEL478]|uniref:glycine--tRNA ligase n=1 Tax=Gonapodya prolifera (strain JEL478) TaxID=1344416 RepID=A0A139AMG9_GONPJ|nr:glycyl-tRNA synthetase [Gonapodya prolifera JEL478]|eukprot:KXS17966.1 glycyl-tRNA synthetase [Gonapodya prolifera JEL478]
MPSSQHRDFNPADLSDHQLSELIGKTTDKIQHLRARDFPPGAVGPEVDRLNILRLEQLQREADTRRVSQRNAPLDRSVLETVLLKRFFYSPSFAIYGGVAGLYDYGPPGCGVQSNLLALWRQHFVIEEDMLEVDCTNLTPHDVFKTSGHVDRFLDYMVRDSDASKPGIFRVDHLIKAVLKERLEEDEKLRKLAQPSQPHADGKKVKKEAKPKFTILEPEVKADYERTLDTLDNLDQNGFKEVLRKFDIRAPDTGNPVTDPEEFNLMFVTQIGPTGALRGYLRPETAQGHFVNFKRLLEFNNQQLPFASASVGKSFRNEIAPRQGLLRVREFTMAEIEHFVDPADKSHPKFKLVKDVRLPLFPRDRQMDGREPIHMTIGEAVAQRIVDNETLGYFVARIGLFLHKIGIDPGRLRFRQHMANEMAHYATDCWDAEILTSYGWIECVGCADRSAYDLTQHSRRTNERLTVQVSLPEPLTRERLVLERNKPRFGPTFKKDAKAVEGYLDSLLDDSCDSAANLGGKDKKDTEKIWDESKLKDLQDRLESGGGKVSVTGTDGKTYELTNDIIKIFKITEKINVREFIPNVIEPSFGIGRILYSLMEHSFYNRQGGDEARNVLAFPVVIAPYKCLVTPISSNELFDPFVDQCSKELRRFNLPIKVDTSSTAIGRRYARNDELGTPFAVTIDFQTVKDGTVTLRERDSLKQIRDTVPVVCGLVADLVAERTTFHQLLLEYPEFVTQDLS